MVEKMKNIAKTPSRGEKVVKRPHIAKKIGGIFRGGGALSTLAPPPSAGARVFKSWSDQKSIFLSQKY